MPRIYPGTSTQNGRRPKDWAVLCLGLHARYSSLEQPKDRYHEAASRRVDRDSVERQVGMYTLGEQGPLCLQLGSIKLKE